MENPKGEMIVLDRESAVADPAAIQATNGKAAQACRDIVLKTSQSIQGHRYIRVEGWQAIANVLGFFVGASDAVRELDSSGNVIGWTAKGFVRDRDGRIVATGDGFVGKDEKRWKSAAEYACRAMAQTRAQSRAARGAFAFLAVMIDPSLKTTPAEEMDADTVSEVVPPPMPRMDRVGINTRAKKAMAALGWEKKDLDAMALASNAAWTAWEKVPNAEAEKLVLELEKEAS